MTAITLPDPHTFTPNPDKTFWQEQCFTCGLPKKHFVHGVE